VTGSVFFDCSIEFVSKRRTIQLFNFHRVRVGQPRVHGCFRRGNLQCFCMFRTGWWLCDSYDVMRVIYLGGLHLNHYSYIVLACCWTVVTLLSCFISEITSADGIRCRKPELLLTLSSSAWPSIKQVSRFRFESPPNNAFK